MKTPQEKGPAEFFFTRFLQNVADFWRNYSQNDTKLILPRHIFIMTAHYTEGK